MASRRKHRDCPYCGLGMRPAVMRCDACQVEVSASFQETQFDRLSGDDLQFLEEYLLAGFSIKALEAESGKGYAAIRNRLDKIIAEYRQLKSNNQAQQAILAAIESGEMSASEAAKAMEQLIP